jgi:hypothetical protein
VKRLCADDSAATSVKVGYRQASYMKNPTVSSAAVGFFSSGAHLRWYVLIGSAFASK